MVGVEPVGQSGGLADQTTILREMVRECEEQVARQVRLLEEFDDKSEHMLTVGVAALAGGMALTSFAMANGLPVGNPMFQAGMALGGGINLWSLLLFAGAYLGFRRPVVLRLGPGLDWIASKANDARWTLADHFLSVLQGFPEHYRWNGEQLLVCARRRASGLYLLLVATLAYALAFGYIFRAHIGV